MGTTAARETGMAGKILAGHMAAILSVLVWGVTFISTKILLEDFGPLEILFYRFFAGWLALWLFCPKLLPLQDLKREGLFALAGFCGVTLYFLLENMALVWTLASNASVIVSIAPFFTALLAWLLIGDPRPGWNFYAGFGLAITGIALISFNGQKLQLNPLGDGLAFFAAISWAFYSIATRKLSELALGTLLTTRRIFFYGLVFILPCFFFAPPQAPLGALLEIRNAGNLLFLGLGASALCFVTWTFALGSIGTASASAYIYLVPVISIISAAAILGEPATPMIISGCALTITGLVASEDRLFLALAKFSRRLLSKGHGAMSRM